MWSFLQEAGANGIGRWATIPITIEHSIAITLQASCLLYSNLSGCLSPFPQVAIDASYGLPFGSISPSGCSQ